MSFSKCQFSSFNFYIAALLIAPFVETNENASKFPVISPILYKLPSLHFLCPHHTISFHCLPTLSINLYRLLVNLLICARFTVIPFSSFLVHTPNVWTAKRNPTKIQAISQKRVIGVNECDWQ